MCGRQRWITTSTSRRAAEKEDQRQGGERQDRQQLEVVDIGDDLRRQRYIRVERRASRRGKRAPDMCDDRIGEQTVDRGNVARDLGVVDLSC
jgi:hypothetical protein